MGGAGSGGDQEERVITTKSRYVAVFRGENKYSKASKVYVGTKLLNLNAGEHTFNKEVIAWDDDGHPLIVGDRCLERADRASNFLGINEAEPDALKVTSIATTNEWLAWRLDEGNGEWWSSRVAGFGIQHNGYATALDICEDGIVEAIDDAKIRHVSDGPPPKETKE